MLTLGGQKGGTRAGKGFPGTLIWPGGLRCVMCSFAARKGRTFLSLTALAEARWHYCVVQHICRWTVAGWEFLGGIASKLRRNALLSATRAAGGKAGQLSWFYRAVLFRVHSTTVPLGWLKADQLLYQRFPPSKETKTGLWFVAESTPVETQWCSSRYTQCVKRALQTSHFLMSLIAKKKKKG